LCLVVRGAHGTGARERPLGSILTDPPAGLNTGTPAPPLRHRRIPPPSPVPFPVTAHRRTPPSPADRQRPSSPPTAADPIAPADTVDPMPSMLDWLRGRTDAQLAELLTARPDLLVPAPGSLEALARRLESPTTARRALERVDAFELQVLHALLLLEATKRDASVSEIAGFLGGPAGVPDVVRAAEHLQTLALVRGGNGRDGSVENFNGGDGTTGNTSDGDGPTGNTSRRGRATPQNRSGPGYRITPAARDALGGYPGGLGPVTGLARDRLEASLAAAGATGRALLDRLVPGPPVGTVDPASPHADAIAELVEWGLLRRIDQRTVVLPREVALALRGSHPLGPALPAAPEPETTDHGPATVDGTAAGQALAAHGRMVRLLDIFGTGSVGTLKSGGIGILAIRRMARDLGLDEHLTALHVELLGATGLIATSIARSGNSGSWLPTQAADAFLSGTEAAGWALLATSWLQMRRDPARAGTRDVANKVCNVLSLELDWRGGPAERHRILAELAALPPGTGRQPDGLHRRLRFHSPRRDPGLLASRTNAILTEATALGVIAFDALSGAGRAVLADDVEGAAAALDAALPPAGDTVLVQADMTVVAPGRLTPELAAALAGAADVESAGGATVYRVSEASLRRALDGGATTEALHELLERHSATPVPQSIGYLIDDVARRHGVLRAGAAGAYLRSDDPTLVSQAVAAAAGAGITLRKLAPTVAVTSAELPQLVEVLRSAGLAPAAEDAAGSVLDLRPRPRRTRITLPPRPHYREPAPPSGEQIAGLVRRMRAGDVAVLTGQDAREVLAVLREAARDRAGVWIGYADAEGGTSRRIVEPIVVSGGSLLAFDRLRRAVRTFPVHRISSAHPEVAG
jgi:hypothetical protein